MITEAQFVEMEAILVKAETEKAVLAQQNRDHLDKAREHNDAGRACRLKITGIDKELEPIRAQMTEYVAEQKRLHAEKLKVERAAREKAEAEAKAKEETELKKAHAEIARLKEELGKKE